ncbi:MAG: pyruvate dehydrogenase complex E1 component subunit beta [Deltaproteobacteria bacterium]|nr:pyruvate dehydrogenase complex E1 component subunit beta [Deltaproteobacteria bacterium]
MAKITYREALNQAIAEEMTRDPRVFLIGEEVGQYDGAYKVSQGLLKQFGEKRVIDTPITEAGFCGLGIGAAMGGLRPIIEMMTFNFAVLAMDQIVNGAAKLRYMSGGQLKVPCVIRGPGGAAHQLAAQHSQCFESHYAFVPGLKVVMPSTPKDAKGLLKSAIRDDNPVIFIEGEILYGAMGDVPDEEYLTPIGVADIKREGTDVTLIAHSKMVYVALTAAKRLEEFGISAEVLDLRTIRPLDESLIVQSVKKTHRCVIVEEGWRYSGVGAQVADVIYNNIFDELDAPVRRVTGLDVPMPYSKPLEHQVIPDAHRVIEAVRDVLYMKG